jgi:hypothetical protein
MMDLSAVFNASGPGNLREIMRLFRLDQWQFLFYRLNSIKDGYYRVHVSDPGTTVGAEDLKETMAIFKEALRLCESLKFADASETIHTSIVRLEKFPFYFDVSSVANECQHVIDAIERGMFKHSFVQVLSDRTQYLLASDTFGERAIQAFKSANYDMQQAGFCLGLELNTAAVFHLMRVAEVGLRALAFDRDVAIPKTILEFATWEEIIRQLESAEDRIKDLPKTPAREAQFDFYHGAMMEFKRFKNKWRNPVMHSRDTYDRDEALSAFTHVSAFMRLLATKISEHTRTPIQWGEEQLRDENCNGRPTASEA